MALAVGTLESDIPEWLGDVSYRRRGLISIKSRRHVERRPVIYPGVTCLIKLATRAP